MGDREDRKIARDFVIQVKTYLPALLALDESQNPPRAFSRGAVWRSGQIYQGHDHTSGRQSNIHNLLYT